MRYYTNTDRQAAAIQAALSVESFSTKSAQKDALADCNTILECLHDDLQKHLLATRIETTDSNGVVHRQWTYANGDDLYYWSHGCHKWNARVEALFADFPDFIAKAREVVGQYLTIKAKPVVPPTKKDQLERRVERSLAAMIAHRTGQMNDAIRSHEIFGNLPVYATWHYVTNQYGTTFRRFQYFMNGEVCALQTILATMDTIAQKELDAKLAKQLGDVK